MTTELQAAAAEIAERDTELLKLLEAERAKVKKLRGVLKELHTTVWNESPHLLDDDRGGDWKLDIEIEEALAETAGE